MRKAILLGCGALLATGQLFAQCPPGQTQVTMTVTTDRYGEETTWSCTGPGGSPVYASGGPYTQQGSNGAYPQTPVDFCVPDGGVVEVTVNDAYGDGMCCNYGDGGWAISVGGTNVSTGGSFATEQTSSVTIGTDLGLGALAMDAVVAQGNNTVTGSVVNGGITTITGFTLAYTVDGNSPVSQNFSASIAPGASYTYSFTTPWNATVAGHTIDLALSGVANDMNDGNNSLSHDVEVATQAVQRVALVEEFTSSTCVPCANFNVTFDPTLGSLNTNEPGSHVAAVKYQMNWPAPGNDPSYNPDGVTRRTYYDVNGIPYPFINGHDMIYGTADEINEAAAKPAFVDLDLSYTRNGNEITVNATANSYANFSGTNKLHIVVTEDFYHYAASTTTQDNFHFAERKMMPNGSGNTLTALTAGSSQNVTQSYTLVEGGPAQGNYNLWGSVDGITVVAFIQNNATKEILQAAISESHVGIDENQQLHLQLYPNPSNGIVNLRYTGPANGKATVDVFNVLGERVFSTNGVLGSEVRTLDLSNLTNGIYYVKVIAGGLQSTRTITLDK